MTVKRNNGTGYSKVSEVSDSDGALFADSTVKVLRSGGTWEEIWPAITTLESFEDGAWPDDWVGSTTQFSLTSTNPIEGVYSAESTATNARVGNPNIGTSTGKVYEALLSPATLNNRLDVFINAQDATAPLTDSYWARLDVPGGRAVTWQRVGGSSTLIATTTFDGITFTAGETYTLRYEIPDDPTTDPITISVIDGTGTTLDSALGTADHLWGSGVLGFGHNGPDAGDRYDSFTEGRF